MIYAALRHATLLSQKGTPNTHEGICPHSYLLHYTPKVPPCHPSIAKGMQLFHEFDVSRPQKSRNREKAEKNGRLHLRSET